MFYQNYLDYEEYKQMVSQSLSDRGLPLFTSALIGKLFFVKRGRLEGISEMPLLPVQEFSVPGI
jgi:hypothetical protein